jgi:AraC-like DNA-binding protein
MTARDPAQGWISVRHLQHIVARGKEAGVSMEALLSEAGLTPAKLSDADGLIPITALETLLSAFSARYSDPLMGLHLASDIQPATFGALGYISQACTTFAEVLEMATRYSGLLSNIGKTSVQFKPGTVELCWECTVGSAFLKRQATEYVLGAFVVLTRFLVPETSDFLKSVHFAHAKPDDAERMREYFAFFKCPVYFDSPASCVVVGSDMLKIRLRHGDAFMKEALDRHAQNLLRQRAQASSLTDEVKHLVGAMIIHGVPTKDMVAMQLGISGRSLHRKLQGLGTSYREILDQVRLEIAQARLQEGADTMNAIADHLGFRSHQAFQRWFKQSIGKTPGEYRKKHSGARA